MILIGTSGFSYADWKGGFYPAGLPSGRMLEYYAQHFPACEINFTYYRIAGPRQAESLVQRSGGRVTFVVKAHQSITHGQDSAPADYRAFLRGLEPLRSSNVLGAVLLQFPYAFQNRRESLDYLAGVQEKLSAADTPMAVEFRHRSWNRPETLAWLRGLGLSYVNVDEPDLEGLLPASAEATGPVGYIRFHGRNRETWFKKDAASWERYDYLYSESELQAWVPKIRAVTERTRITFVFFNNHWESKAVANAKQMAGLLDVKLKENG